MHTEEAWWAVAPLLPLWYFGVDVVLKLLVLAVRLLSFALGLEAVRRIGRATRVDIVVAGAEMAVRLFKCVCREMGAHRYVIVALLYVLFGGRMMSPALPSVIRSGIGGAAEAALSSAAACKGTASIWSCQQPTTSVIDVAAEHDGIEVGELVEVARERERERETER